MNVGFVEALREAPFDCFVFSDVDLLSLDDRNLYRCGSQPRHLSVAVDKFNFRTRLTSPTSGKAMSKESERHVEQPVFNESMWPGLGNQKRPKGHGPSPQESEQE
ncbi:unnamed protein product [Lampetra fluviatilis]